jgi:CubicO group peptidase (beta-lactamase class C family)
VVLAVAVHDMAGEGLIDLDRPVAGKFAFPDDAAKVSPSRSTIRF